MFRDGSEVENETGVSVCSLHSTSRHHADEEEKRANARLISAAPDLLAGLKDMFALLEEGYLVRDIRDDSKPGFAIRQLPYMQRFSRAKAAITKAES